MNPGAKYLGSSFLCLLKMLPHLCWLRKVYPTRTCFVTKSHTINPFLTGGLGEGWLVLLNSLCVMTKHPSFISPRCDRPYGSGGTGGRTSTPSVPVWQGPCPSPPPRPASASTASSNPQLSEPGGRGCTRCRCPHCGAPLGGGHGTGPGPACGPSPTRRA